LLERCIELAGETGPVALVAVQISAQIQGCDLVILVELVPLALRKPVGVRFQHLVVLFEFAVEGVEIAHIAATVPSGRPAISSRRPFNDARAMVAAAYNTTAKTSQRSRSSGIDLMISAAMRTAGMPPMVSPITI